ncbi:hypothetical protein AVEN_151882-1 [Araneus ventricosus]|uniref:CCHC-type domain-containing protein n=1 Tax=Araneus ventricosus TaxID=182803 RepID=A0A4Y2W3I2_ARAVE|nr:hypothetical protein AVEN_151882-1 [Araneus ventricosus]
MLLGKKNTLDGNPNVTCWKCNKRGTYRGECQTISANQENYGRLTGRGCLFSNEALKKDPKFPHFAEEEMDSAQEGSIASHGAVLVDTSANVTLRSFPEGVLVAATLVDLKGAIPFEFDVDHKPRPSTRAVIATYVSQWWISLLRPLRFSESLRLRNLGEVEGLNEEQTAVKDCYKNFQNLFSTSDSDIRPLQYDSALEFTVSSTNQTISKTFASCKRKKRQALVKEMVDNGIIEESSGPWASPIVLVKKKDGCTFLC